MTISLTEENYLKAIYTLSNLFEESEVSTNQISDHLNNKAATVTDMLKRLAEKKLIHYIPYQGVKLTEKGKNLNQMHDEAHKRMSNMMISNLEASEVKQLEVLLGKVFRKH